MTVATGLDTTDPSAGRAALVRWAWRLAPVWCGLGALVLDLALLARRSVRWQEAQAVAAASGDWGDLWHAIRGHEAPHAAADALLKLWIGAAGSGEWAIRAPAALAGAVAVALTCALGTRLLGRVGGLVAAGALATNAIVLAWSQTAGSESLALVAVVLATLALVSALDRPVWWRLALWGVASVAAVAISLLALPAILAHVAAWAARGPRSQWRTPAVTAGVVALSAIAMAAFVATSDAGTLAWGAPDGGDLGLDVWRLIGWSPVPAALAAVGLFVLVTGRLDGASTWKAVLLGAWLGIPLAAGLLFSLARSSFEPGYAVSATPALALLAAAGVVAQRRELALGLAALLGVSAVATVSVWYAAPSEEDWRAAIATIRAEQRAGEAVVVLPARQRVAADYYAGAGYGVTRPRGRRVWLLLAEDDGARRLRLGRKLVRPPRYALLEERRFGDRLWLQVWAVP